MKGEVLLVPEQRCTNKKWRDGYDFTFRKRKVKVRVKRKRGKRRLQDY